MKDVGFDAAFLSAASASRPIQQSDIENMVNNVYTVLNHANPAITQSVVSSRMAGMTVANANTGLAAITATNGVSDRMLSLGGTLGIGFGGSEGPDCAALDIIFGILGGIFAVLSIMCILPEPAIVVICPAVAVIGALLGLLAFIIWVLCYS
jgi:hypothetical protein